MRSQLDRLPRRRLSAGLGFGAAMGSFGRRQNFGGSRQRGGSIVRLLSNVSAVPRSVCRSDLRSNYGRAQNMKKAELAGTIEAISRARKMLAQSLIHGASMTFHLISFDQPASLRNCQEKASWPPDK